MKTFKQLLEQSKETWIGTTDHKENNHLVSHDDRAKTYANHGPLIHDKQEITPEEINASQRYGFGGYEAINKHHRGIPFEKNEYGTPEEQDPATAPRLSKHLDSIISKHTIKNNLHVWRGIDDKAKEKLKLGVHSIIHDKGYVSTSLDPRVSQGEGSHIMHIKVPKGSKGLHLNSYPEIHSFPEEHEVLLPRGSRFKYEGNEKGYNHKGHQITIHHLTHIPE